MAQRAAAAEKRRSITGSLNEEGGSGPKQLKQGRLPFKPLDCKPLTSINNTSSRKRKLSGQASPNAKAKVPKLPDVKHSAEKGKPAPVNDDNEVSSTSSSEAEHLATTGSKSKASKTNLLEKFVRREDEISSTNDVIDLTESMDENDPKENSPVKVKSPRKSVLKSPRPKSEPQTKDKPEANFSRKLIFDEEAAKPGTKVLGKYVAQKKEKEPEKHEAKNECEKDVAPQQEKAVEQASKTVSKECASPNEKKASTPENVCVENVTTVSDEEEGEIEQEGNESIQADEEVTPLKDTSSNPSACETSMDHSLTSQKEDGESSSASKTPANKERLSSAHTPQTPSANTSCSSADGTTPLTSSKKKVMSKRQQDKAALRQKVKEEKEKQKQEAKEQKEKERLEKKQKRDQEKAEKERTKREEKEKKEKERLEKKEQIEKEKQSKLQQKEEEKQKKLEKLSAKMEEKKVKEEEKRQKEEQKQKEEDEKLRQAEKRKAAFTSFFINPTSVTSTKVTKTEDELFIPFELKKDMTLAPVRRQTLSEEDKQHLDKILSNEVTAENWYLDELRQQIRTPLRISRVLRKKKEVEQEVELLVHDSETVKKVTHAVKLLQFHTDYRPPYYGTWRKKVKGLSPRNPWKKDEEVFDYEVDSDEEWEEEEPGESLSDSNGEEEEGEDEDEGDDDGWMVPHGYLSEDEGCQDDEDVTPEVLKARQRAKAQAWEAELKAKKRMLPPLHLGCFWLDRPCVSQEHLTIFKEFEMVCLRSSPIETLVSCPTISDGAGESADTSKSSPTSKRFRKQALPEEAMPDLIRMLHGNSFGIKKLVREFRLYWKQKCGDVNLSLNESHMEDDSKALNDSAMDTSANLDSSELKTVEPVDTLGHAEKEPMQVDPQDKAAEEEATGKKQDDSVVNEETAYSCVSKRQLEIKIMSIAVREKREGKKQCWYVSDKILEQYGMEDLPLENSWVYVSGDMSKKTEKKTPNQVADKKTSTPSAGKKTPKVQELGKQTDVISDVDSTCTPHRGKDEASMNTTPKQGKSKKEASAKKTPKDQLSIMAYAKKTVVGSAGEKAEHKDDSNHSATKTKANVTSDQNVQVKDQVGTEKPADSQQSVEPMDEDCIILD